MTPERRKAQQDETTALYDEANRLNKNGLPDLTGIMPQDENDTTKDYLTAARRNNVTPIAQPAAAGTDED